MSENVYLKDTTLSAIGDAIRYKTGKSGLLLPSQMPDEIRSISGGGGGGNIETDYIEDLSSNFMQTVSDYFNGDLNKIVSFCGFRDITTNNSHYTIPHIFFYHKGLNPIIKDQRVSHLSGTFDILICDEFADDGYYGYRKYLWQTSPATPENSMLGLIYDSSDDQLKLVIYAGTYWNVTSSSVTRGLAYLSQEV